MDPEPLVRVLANGVFDGFLDRGGVGLDVACHGDFGVEVQDMALLLSDQKANPGMTAAPLRAAILAKVVPLHAGLPKKSTKAPCFRNHVLVDQYSDRFVSPQSLQNRTGEIALADEVVAGHAAAALHEGVETGIVERADHYSHRRGQDGVSVGAELPVSQVSGGEKDAFAASHGDFEVLVAVVADPLRQRYRDG